MTDTSELDCMKLVLTTPKANDFHVVSVVLRNNFSSKPPVKALNPSSSESMPNKNIATPAEISLKFVLSQKP